ncbi:MAG TPA: uridine kinase [Candidatus Binatia bacterium]|nr:uridine kinase [Candidatus Binatia bacterium]
MNRPLLVAIAGGSGAGKTWLSHHIAEAFPGRVTAVSLDDFYQDRSRLAPSARQRINYDHPRAIEWPLLRKFLENYRNGRKPILPKYDFKVHCRTNNAMTCEVNPILVVEGLWVLSRRDIRNAFDVTIYIDCPEQMRLERRITRDVAERGRSARAVREQFRRSVAPMHRLYVESQKRWANVVLECPIFTPDVDFIIQRLRAVVLGGDAPPNLLLPPRIQITAAMDGRLVA